MRSKFNGEPMNSGIRSILVVQVDQAETGIFGTMDGQLMNVFNSGETSADICEDCGAMAAEGQAGCLKLFEEVIAREFSDFRYGKIHRLTVDAYSLQHPARYLRSGKSFAAHLTGIYAALEAEDAAAVNKTMRKWLNSNPKIEKPARLPERGGNLTITFIHSAACADEHVKRVQEWAQEVWSAWTEHHALAKQLIDEAARENNKR